MSELTTRKTKPCPTDAFFPALDLFLCDLLDWYPFFHTDDFSLNVQDGMKSVIDEFADSDDTPAEKLCLLGAIMFALYESDLVEIPKLDDIPI